MHPGQQQFLSFILDRVHDDKKEEAKKVLEECFALQEKGEFKAEQMAASVPRILGTLKDEFVDEVKGIMQQFGGQHTDK